MNVLPVCDKPYHKIKENMPLGDELEKLWNYLLMKQYAARKPHAFYILLP